MSIYNFIRYIFYGLLFSIVPFMGDLQAQFSGGSGTSDDPYQISTLTQLQSIEQHLDKHFVLLNDIDASESIYWNAGKGFEPIGNENTPFTGVFDGNGQEILGLSIQRNSGEFIGFFGHTDGAIIKSLSLINVNIRGANETGGLAGKVTGGEISLIKVTGDIRGRTHTGSIAGFNRSGRIEFVIAEAIVTGRSYVGGLAGINRGRIIQSSFDGQVKATGHNLGGIAGNNYDGLIAESFSRGSVTGESVSSVGGVAGSNGGNIFRSYSEASVTGRAYVGGLVGNNHQGIISWSYSTGAVEGFNLVGGLVGVNHRNGEITESYTTSPVTGVVDYGGFIGVNRDPVEFSYWNKESSPGMNAVSKGVEDGITGLCDNKMKGYQSMDSMHGLSFNQIWGYVEDAPPQHLWEMPYFAITDVEAVSGIISGDIVNVEITLKNVGSMADISDLVLRHPNGEIIDRAEQISLMPGQSFKTNFNWQTELDDHGVFTLLAETKHYKKNIPVQVAKLPDPVDLDQPYVLEEHVSLTPTFSWEKAFLAESYDLQISKNEDFIFTDVEITDIDTTNYTLTQKLDHHTYYHWRIRATNSDTTGPWSNISEFTTIIEKPAPVRLKAPDSGKKNASTQPVFAWTTANRAEEYFLQIAADEDFESVMFDTTVVATDSSLAMSRPLPQKQQVYWRMRAQNMGGESAWSDAWSFVPLIPPPKKSGVNTLDYALGQNYPNPFNPVTYIPYSLPEPGRVQLEVLNMLGQTVAKLVDGYKSAGWHTAVFDASELSSGFYIYRIKAKNFESTKKLSLVK